MQWLHSLPNLFFFCGLVYIQVIHCALKKTWGNLNMSLVNGPVREARKVLSSIGYDQISYLWVLSKKLSILSVNFIVLTSHSGFFFFLLVDLVCFEAKYLTGRRGRMLWSPTRNPPLVAIFDIFLISRLPVCGAQAPLGDVRNEAMFDVMDRWGLNPTGSRSSLNMVFTFQSVIITYTQCGCWLWREKSCRLCRTLTSCLALRHMSSV